MCSNIGTPKTINFPFDTNGKLMVLGVPILKHFRVGCLRKSGGQKIDSEFLYFFFFFDY